MTENVALPRPAASAAVESAGWRLVLASLVASVDVADLPAAAALAKVAIDACGADADEHLTIDLRPDHVELRLQSRSSASVTSRDTKLALAITAALDGRGVRPSAAGPRRPVQQLELAIDALDIPAVRPFWKAVLGYVDEVGAGPTGWLVDPAGQQPGIWFQQMDAPRPQRNRIHFDLDLAHDDAERRLAAALGAGGVLVNADNARAWWVLADAEGNEICICTWQDRD
jgi:4a-hydroxytetrahydrobiopterin dehydratase